MAAYIEQLQLKHSKPTVKQHLAAIKMLFDWLVTGQIVPVNPAQSVRGPRHSVKKGKTSVLSAEEMGSLFASFEVTTLIGLRDRALIGVMGYTFARVGVGEASRKRREGQRTSLSPQPRAVLRRVVDRFRTCC